MSTPILPLALWLSGTNQNSIPANDNALRLEALHREIISQAVTAQPESPADGDTYIIAATHTGALWSGFTPGDITIFKGGNWFAWAPTEGLVVNVAGGLFKFDGGEWVAASTGGGTATWGAIDGSLSDQTDLQAALDAKGAAGIPQNSQSANYTLVLADANKHILHPSADTSARTMTIPANADVAFPIGTALTFVNQDAAGVMTIAIATDTMRLAGAGTTGSTTLAANGMATALKIASTEWIISGAGLT